MATSTHIRTGFLRALVCSALLLPASAPASRLELKAPSAQLITITYTTHNGHTRNAYVQLPYGYRPNNRQPIPLVISPHGRGVDGRINSRRWGNLPTLGRFAVVSPDGYGRRLSLHSWGFRGQIDDLARMADVVETALPWVRVDRSRIYAVGASMGAQETLLLVGRYPGLLAGAVAVDGPADFALQYRNFGRLPCDAACASRGWGQVGPARQRLARREIGGDPRTAVAEFAKRSPLTYARTIAASCVPVQIWWSRTDGTVLDAARQSGGMFRALTRANPRAPVDEFVGDWPHTEAMHDRTDLPKMLAGLGLLPQSFNLERLNAVHHGRPTAGRCAQVARD
jgi:pimeloyl-ACP methyl ester carboxylesterase